MNMVNQAWARAAQQQAPKVRDHLITVFREKYPKKTDDEIGVLIDEMATRMGRHSPPPCHR